MERRVALKVHHFNVGAMAEQHDAAVQTGPHHHKMQRSLQKTKERDGGKIIQKNFGELRSVNARKGGRKHTSPMSLRPTYKKGQGAITYKKDKEPLHTKKDKRPLVQTFDFNKKKAGTSFIF